MLKTDLRGGRGCGGGGGGLKMVKTDLRGGVLTCEPVRRSSATQSSPKAKVPNVSSSVVHDARSSEACRHRPIGRSLVAVQVVF